MNKYNLSFNHLGLAVTRTEKAVNFIRGLGYSIGKEIYDPEQKVNSILCRSKSMPDIEIISKSRESGPLDNVLKNRNELIYHICYRTYDVAESLRLMKEDNNRVICVSSSKPTILFPNKFVSFYFVEGFGLVEIIEF